MAASFRYTSSPLAVLACYTVLPSCVIGMGCHAFVNFGGSEHQDNGAHSRKVINAKLTRPVVGCSFDLASLNKGADDRLLAVWGAFFHVGFIT